MITGDDEEEDPKWAVEGILGNRPLMKGKRTLHFKDGTPAYQYWVLWSGYDVEHNWEALTSFDHAKDTIESNTSTRSWAHGPAQVGRDARYRPSLVLSTSPVDYLVFALFKRESLPGTQGSAKPRDVIRLHLCTPLGMGVGVGPQLRCRYTFFIHHGMCRLQLAARSLHALDRFWGGGGGKYTR
jgi:hypothetical protein